MGPMAGEFHEAFGLGHDEERISTIDADGVATGVGAATAIRDMADADVQLLV